MKQIIRRFVFLMVVALVALQTQAQDRPRKFDPARFEADLEQFITTEVGLNPHQAAKFFPVYREMQRKQRMLFNKMRYYQHVDTRDNKAAEKAIKECDLIDLEMKELQQEYHKRFCKMLPAGVVLQIIRADEKFHRQSFQRMMRHGRR